MIEARAASGGRAEGSLVRQAATRSRTRDDIPSSMGWPYTTR